MIEKLDKALEELEAAQDRIKEANDAGFVLGFNGHRYISPFEAFPGICPNKDNQTDHFVAYHYDKSYLEGYSRFLKQNPSAIEDIMHRKLVKKYKVIDEALQMGAEAYAEGRKSSNIIEDVYGLLNGVPGDTRHSLYDAWELGYLLSKMYDKQLQGQGETYRNQDEPHWYFDYDRAFEFVRAVDTVTRIAEEEGCEDNPYKLDIEGIIRDNQYTVEPMSEDEIKLLNKVVRVALNAKEFCGSAGDKVLECLACPYFYGVQDSLQNRFSGGNYCERSCEAETDAIRLVLGPDEDLIYKWMVRHD